MVLVSVQAPLRRQDRDRGRPLARRLDRAPGPSVDHATPRPDRRAAGRLLGPSAWPWWVALATVLLRLPYLHAPMSPDEGGFLTVGADWHRGSSLYGDLWVDRPPLLVALFRLAAVLGGQAHGLTALRLLGCVAAAATVLGVALAARALDLPGHARAWAPTAGAAVTGALLVCIAGGGSVVNGELLAAPFLALGAAASLRAARPGPRAGRWALLAGAAGAAAVLVKQNMLDVAVLLVVLLVAGALRDRSWSHARRQAGLALLGGALGAAAVLLPAWAAGTSPAGVFEAMYPFRLKAAAVMNTTAEERVDHGQSMLAIWVTTGAPVLLVGFAAWVLRRGLRDPKALAVAALLVFDAVSIGLGGSFWLHYVVQLVVGTGLAAALLVGRTRVVGAALTAVVLAACLVGWGVGLGQHTTAEGDVAGRAIAAAARPGDRVVSLLGDADVVRASGLTPAYTYLWSLPARTLDPGFHHLAAVLDAPDRPTWVVVRGPQTLALLHHDHVGLERHYRQVTTICAHPVLVRTDVRRPVPVPATSCRQPFVSTHAPGTP